MTTPSGGAAAQTLPRARCQRAVRGLDALSSCHFAEIKRADFVRVRVRGSSPTCSGTIPNPEVAVGIEALAPSPCAPSETRESSLAATHSAPS